MLGKSVKSRMCKEQKRGTSRLGWWRKEERGSDGGVIKGNVGQRTTGTSLKQRIPRIVPVCFSQSNGVDWDGWQRTARRDVTRRWCVMRDAGRRSATAPGQQSYMRKETKGQGISALYREWEWDGQRKAHTREPKEAKRKVVWMRRVDDVMVRLRVCANEQSRQEQRREWCTSAEK